MNYDEFVSAMLECAKEKMKPDEQAEVQKVSKNNGTTMVGICLRNQKNAIAPLIYMEDFFERYLEGEKLEVLADVFLERSRDAGKIAGWDYKEMFDFFKMKEKICFKLINTEKNREFLRNVPHFEVLDFSVVFYLNIQIDGSESGAIAINKGHIDLWKVTTSVLYECAKENMPKIYPPLLCTLSELIAIPFSDDYRKDPVLVLTNKSGFYGASVLLYSGMPKQIYEQTGGCYYLLPASVHEFLIVPESFDISKEQLNDMVREVNRTQILPEEVLSDHIYYFDGNNITKM